MTRRVQLTGVLVCALLGWAAPVHADAISDWNEITSNAVIAAGPTRPGPATILDFAMVHAAVFDAVNAIDGRFKPYHVRIRGAHGSQVAATAKAAHDVLVHLFPAQQSALDQIYADYLEAHDIEAHDPGVRVGRRAAAEIVALRRNDGSFPANFPAFNGADEPGVWRPTPPGNLTMAAPWLGFVRPYTLKRPSQFRPGPPPRLTSRLYTRDYNEVKALGSADNSTRTADQTELARFWLDNFIVQWNRALRGVAQTYVNTLGDSARLFALANLASADAIITAWDSKSHFVFWRPITAIREGNNDGNRRTIGDAGWTPLAVTPPYPDYTSGANNITGAMTRILALFFGTEEMTFTVTSNAPLVVQTTRTFTRFSDPSDEVVEARILQGIHFRAADEVAQRQGRRVARWAFRHFLQPVGHRHDDDDDDDDDD